MPRNTSSSRKPKPAGKAKASRSARQPENGWKKLFNLRELLRGDTPHFVVGISLLVLSAFLLLGFISFIFTAKADQFYIDAWQTGDTFGRTVSNSAGKLGVISAHFFMNQCFGFSALFIPLFMLFAGLRLMNVYHINLWRKFLNFAFLMIWLSVAFTALTPESLLNTLGFEPGGMHGVKLCGIVSEACGVYGLYLILFLTAVLYLIYISKRTISVIRTVMHPSEEQRAKLCFWQRWLGRKEKPQDDADASDEPDDSDDADEPADDQPFIDPFGPAYPMDEPTEDASDEIELEPDDEPEGDGDGQDAELDIVVPEPEDDADANVLGEYNPKLDLAHYKYPTLDLLNVSDDNLPDIDRAEQQANKERIIEVLHNYGVEIDSVKATVGPTVTLYEITPAAGVRIAKIRNLEDDIALSLSALGIRIIAPIPGKGTIGIEVPNKKPCIVTMESVLNTQKFKNTDYDLPIALGKTITNEVFIADLAKMPHLLVAGATGQGKSVGLNAIITSLIYKKHPAELKMVLIDPKKVEFSVYSSLANHFLAALPEFEEEPIITDVTKVVHTLKSLCQEMDSRYDLLKQARCRNIKEYNAKFLARQLNPDKGHHFLPYFVIIIDEFGDLIMTAGKEVELPIARIAQLARAVGMHMVIATQRPTTNIITGTIKANFPARMAFKVLAQIDSRTILDQSGANQLAGKGDMLILTGGMLPTRVQCAFISTEEVEEVNNYIAQQQGYLSPYELPEVQMDDEGGSAAAADLNNLDPLFGEAARMIVIHQQGSTSLIQRKFSIGYNRAGKIVDQLERAGIVGPTRGAKPRDVLCADEADLAQRLADLGVNI